MDNGFVDKYKPSLVTQFQKARLDEWIGDLESAHKLYEEIKKESGNGEKGLAYIMEPIVKERKKIIEEKMDYHLVASEQVGGSIRELKEPFLLYEPSDLRPKSTFDHLILSHKTRWKYTVSTVSRVDNDLKLEIRGYNPENHVPDLNFQLLENSYLWSLSVADAA